MPRYEYRNLSPTRAAEETFLAWIDSLDREFMNRDPEHRSVVVRDTLHQLYLGRPYVPPDPGAPMAAQAQVHSFDPRNATLQPEYYGLADAAQHPAANPPIRFGILYDRWPVGP